MRIKSYATLVFWGAFLGTRMLAGEDKPFRMHLDTPMRHFTIPTVDEEGNKLWRCSGDTARYLSNNDVDIECMTIEWYSPSNSQIVEMTVRSPHALVSLSHHTARGEGLLTVYNVGYTVIGEDWTWEGRSADHHFSKIIIRKDAHVTFFD
jgi:hypothetical protein